MKKRLLIIALLTICVFSLSAGNKDFSLWKENGNISKLVEYVEDVTNINSSNYIPQKDRIAVFDLDGTLICEQFPIYVEWMLYAQRVLLDSSCESTSEMKDVARAVVKAGSERNIGHELEEQQSRMYGKAFDKMPVSEYKQYIENFLSQKADGFDNLTLKDAYFRPMVEVINYLEKNNFIIYICSGTERNFDRVMLSQFTNIPNYRVIGSDYYLEGTQHNDVYYLNYHFEPNEEVMMDKTRIIKNVKSSKVVQIAQEIGQKPVLAFGNSSGDTSMFIYTSYGNKYKNAVFCIVPDDDEREYAYPQKVKDLQKTCKQNNWNVISMKNDFLTIYGPEVTKNKNNTAFIDSFKTNEPKYSYKQSRVIEVDGRQGIAYSDGFYYVSGSTTLTKYDKNWNVVATNTNPFSEGYKAKVNHIGDIDVCDNEIYCGVELFLDGEASNIQIAVYDANTLKLKRSFPFSKESLQTECSGIAVNPDNNTVWMCSWADGESGRYLYKYDKNTGTYLGKIHMHAVPQWIQGVAYFNGSYYVSADDGTADDKEPDHIYRLDIKEGKTHVNAIEELSLDDVRLQGEIEGLSFDKEKNEMLVLYNRGSRIILGMPTGFYPGYNREIHEVYVYSFK